MAHWNLQSTHFTRTFANSNYFSFPFRVWVTGQGFYCIFLFRVHSLFQEGSVGWKLAGRVMSSECVDSWKMPNRVGSHILKEQAVQNVFLCWFFAKYYGMFRTACYLACYVLQHWSLNCHVLLQGTQREMASVLISDLYGKHLTQNDIAKGLLSNIIYS